MVSNRTAWILIWIGLIGVFGSHVYMLRFGLPPEQMLAHAWGNIIAGGLILWGIILNR